MPAQHSSSPPANLLMPPQSLALRPSPLPEALDGLSMVWLRIVERKGSPVVALMPGVEVLYPGVLDDPRVADTADKRIPDMVDHDSVTPAVVDIAMVEGPVVVGHVLRFLEKGGSRREALLR